MTLDRCQNISRTERTGHITHVKSSIFSLYKRFSTPHSSPSHLEFHRSAMVGRNSPRAKSSDGFGWYIYAGVSVIGILSLWMLLMFIPSNSQSPQIQNQTQTQTQTQPRTISTLHITNCSQSHGAGVVSDPSTQTFYDDPNLSYTIDEPIIKNWDQKRTEWLEQHPSYASGLQDRILVLTGSQPGPCKNPIGDHLLLRFFKNKVDYCRIHGYDIFYSNVLFHPKMVTWWCKIPLVRAAMIAHPEAEWIWWVDSDAAFTNMDFKLPLDRYKDHNFVIHGWAKEVYERKNWVGINAGVFLIRNCQWSMDFMDVWASMSPISPKYDEWGKILTSTFKEKIFPESDDQSALVYLLLKEKETWAKKIYIEHEYYFQGYWVDIVDSLDDIAKKYKDLERKEGALRRRHAEKVSEYYGAMTEVYVKNEAKGGLRRPFVTHFTGCQPCGGATSKAYSWEACWNGMQKVLNFADNQVLHSFGFEHPDLLDSSRISPLPVHPPS